MSWLEGISIAAAVASVAGLLTLIVLAWRAGKWLRVSAIVLVVGLVTIAGTTTLFMTAGIEVGENLPLPAPASPPPAPDPSGSGSSLEDVVVTGSSAESYHGPVWNLWFEDSLHHTASFKPLPMLRPNGAYTLFAHLSARKFVLEGVVVEDIGAEVLHQLRNIPADTTEVTLRLMYDPAFFRQPPDASVTAPMIVNLGKLRSLTMAQVMDAQASGDPLLDFGKASFYLTTIGREGTTGIGISIWANGLPIGELGAKFCVSATTTDECSEEPGYVTSLRGADAVRVGPERKDLAVPDGALQFFPHGNQTVTGVFRCNTCGWPKDRLVSWQLKMREDKLLEYLSTRIQPAFQNAVEYDEIKDFQNAGSDFYRVLFVNGHADGQQARASFESFLAGAPKKAGSKPPSLFVRFVTSSEEPDIYGLPLALIRAPMPGGGEDFLGHHFRIEIPLQRQDYTQSETCIRDWVALVPPDTKPNGEAQDVDLVKVRGPLNDWITHLQSASGNARVFEHLSDFRTWLANDLPWDEHGKPVPPTSGVGIAILSHHEDGAIYFDKIQRTDEIRAASISRVFGAPSIAFVNACGAAAPGAVDFITGFNSQGVPTVIAASTTAEPEMAGEFMRTLLDEFSAHDGGYTIGEAAFDAHQRLKDRFGPRPLIFSVYGNSAARLCK